MSSWSDREWIRKPRRGLEYIAARAPVVKRAYWRYAPEYYRWLIRRRMHKKIEFEAPLDPVKVVSADPDMISRFTGRKNAHVDRWRHIGKIKDGEWDRRPPLRPDTPPYLQEIATSDQIEDTILYKSIKERFVDGVPWTDTELLDRSFRGICNGYNVLQSDSKEEILQKCNKIDQLWEDIDDGGYRTQFELAMAQGIPSNRIGYLDLITNEITVDIGREGELLFVDGRHRLSIAKVMELDSVPVMILARHKNWIERRDELLTDTAENVTHPDL